MRVWLVRHEESLGNVLAKEAKEKRLLQIETPCSNPELPLSDDGYSRAALIKLPFPDCTFNDRGFAWHESIKPTVFCSTYKRAYQTANLAGCSSYALDERLRDRELGILDGLTLDGMKLLVPEQFAIRERLGKFYHRPPGGESWADVALRVRAFFTEKKLLGFDNLLVFSHDVTILAAIYICNNLTPDEILDYQKTTPVLNGSITALEF